MHKENINFAYHPSSYWWNRRWWFLHLYATSCFKPYKILHFRPRVDQQIHTWWVQVSLTTWTKETEELLVRFLHHQIHRWKMNSTADSSMLRCAVINNNSLPKRFSTRNSIKYSYCKIKVKPSDPGKKLDQVCKSLRHFLWLLQSSSSLPK